MPRRSSAAAPRRRSRRLRPAADDSPSRYIARIDKRTGAEIRGPIDPGELLVHAHRDLHPVEVAAQFMASRLVRLTGREDAVDAGMRRVNAVGARVAEMAATIAGRPEIESQAKKLLGVMGRPSYFRFREATLLREREVRARIAKLQRDAAAALKAQGRAPRLRVLLTGATGFVGK